MEYARLKVYQGGNKVTEQPFPLCFLLFKSIGGGENGLKWNHVHTQ